MPDVFISYAHRDNRTPHYDASGWIDRFATCLKLRLDAIRPGTTVWHDESDGRIRGSSVLTGTISDELRACAVLLVVMSPAYLASTWCQRELEFFCNAAAAGGGLRVGNRSRIVKANKLPVGEAPVPQPAEMTDAKGFAFFERDKSGHPLELNPPFGSDLGSAFTRTLNDLAYDIAELLSLRAARPVEMKRSAPPSGLTIYLAETSSDVGEQREQLRREFELNGHTVVPAADLPHGPNYHERVAELLTPARCSVHVIGESYGIRPERSDRSIVEMQYEAAGKLRDGQPDFRRILWLPPGLRASDGQQREFIERLQNDPELVVAPIEEVKRIVRDALAPPPPALKLAAPAAGTSKSVYLIFDPNDRDAARTVNDWIFERGVDVRLPSASTNNAEWRRVNTLHLKSCDGVVIYHGNTTESWLFSKLNDLERIHGQGRPRKRPILPAVVLVDPERQDKKDFRTHRAMTIAGFGNFEPAQLQGYIDLLLALDGES